MDEFNVARSSGATYNSFIHGLRTQLQNPGSFSHNRPVLPPQQNPPTQWFDIVLRTESQNVRFRIRRDNLYLEGYRAEESNQWLEFDNSGNTHLIGGSTFLGFSGSYISLQNAAGQRREKIKLGRQPLVRAVNLLATSTDHEERAHSLIVVIQMICEAVRFATISDFLVGHFTEDVPPTNQIIALENGWADVSGALLHADNDPAGPFRLPRPNNMLIDTAEEAVAAIGILLRYRISRRSRHQLMATDHDEHVENCLADYPDGRPLVEIFWVRIDNIDEEDQSDLYGTITATDGLSGLSIYNRARDDYESIGPGQYATLTGPPRAISAAGSFTIDLSLWDKDSDPSSDHELSRGQIEWNAYDPDNTYDELRSETISGKDGSATINYIVMSNAAEALVEVILITGDGDDPANVYGTITARNAYGEALFFRRGSEDCVQVRPQQDIPLLRSVMAVPLGTELVIDAELWDHDSDPADDQIANGSARLNPQISTSTTASISGKSGIVEVRVAWS